MDWNIVAARVNLVRFARRTILRHSKIRLFILQRLDYCDTDNSYKNFIIMKTSHNAQKSIGFEFGERDEKLHCVPYHQYKCIYIKKTIS